MSKYHIGQVEDLCVFYFGKMTFQILKRQIRRIPKVYYIRIRK